MKQWLHPDPHPQGPTTYRFRGLVLDVAPTNRPMTHMEVRLDGRYIGSIYNPFPDNLIVSSYKVNTINHPSVFYLRNPPPYRNFSECLNAMMEIYFGLFVGLDI